MGGQLDELLASLAARCRALLYFVYCVRGDKKIRMTDTEPKPRSTVF